MIMVGAENRPFNYIVALIRELLEKDTRSNTSLQKAKAYLSKGLFELNITNTFQGPTFLEHFWP